MLNRISLSLEVISYIDSVSLRMVSRKDKKITLVVFLIFKSYSSHQLVWSCLWPSSPHPVTLLCQTEVIFCLINTQQVNSVCCHIPNGQEQSYDTSKAFGCLVFRKKISVIYQARRNVPLKNGSAQPNMSKKNKSKNVPLNSFKQLVLIVKVLCD